MELQNQGQPTSAADKDLIEFFVLKGLLAAGKSVRCRIVSDSMEPLIQTGEFVQVKPFENSLKLKRFDLVVYFKDGRFVCHFLWLISRHPTRQFYFKSFKAPWLLDDPVFPTDLLGIVDDKTISKSKRVYFVSGVLFRKILGFT